MRPDLKKYLRFRLFVIIEFFVRSFSFLIVKLNPVVASPRAAPQALECHPLCSCIFPANNRDKQEPASASGVALRDIPAMALTTQQIVQWCDGDRTYLREDRSAPRPRGAAMPDFMRSA
jgi:hypothetical protein